MKRDPQSNPAGREVARAIAERERDGQPAWVPRFYDHIDPDPRTDPRGTPA